MAYPLQIIVAPCMIAVGHLIPDHLPGEAPMPVLVGWVQGGVWLLLWAGASAGPLFQVSQTVPMLIGASIAVMRRRGGEAAPIDFGHVMPWRYGLLVLIPAVAIPIQGVLVVDMPGWVAEMNVWVALPAVGAGGLAWVMAFPAAWRRRGGPGPDRMRHKKT